MRAAGPVDPRDRRGSLLSGVAFAGTSSEGPGAVDEESLTLTLCEPVR